MRLSVTDRLTKWATISLRFLNLKYILLFTITGFPANCVPLRYSGRKFSEFLRKRYAYKVQWSKIWGFFGKGMPIRYSRYLKNHETERVCL